MSQPGDIIGTQTFLIESAMSDTVSGGTSRNASQLNSKFSTKALFEMKRGDRVSVEMASISSRNAGSGQSTIEFTGTNILQNGSVTRLTDDEVILEVYFWLSHNGNHIGLPARLGCNAGQNSTLNTGPYNPPLVCPRIKTAPYNREVGFKNMSYFQNSKLQIIRPRDAIAGNHTNGIWVPPLATDTALTICFPQGEPWFSCTPITGTNPGNFGDNPPITPGALDSKVTDLPNIGWASPIFVPKSVLAGSSAGSKWNNWNNSVTPPIQLTNAYPNDMMGTGKPYFRTNPKVSFAIYGHRTALAPTITVVGPPPPGTSFKSLILCRNAGYSYDSQTPALAPLALPADVGINTDNSYPNAGTFVNGWGVNWFDIFPKAGGGAPNGIGLPNSSNGPFAVPAVGAGAQDAGNVSSPMSKLFMFMLDLKPNENAATPLITLPFGRGEQDYKQTTPTNYLNSGIGVCIQGTAIPAGTWGFQPATCCNIGGKYAVESISQEDNPATPSQGTNRIMISWADNMLYPNLIFPGGGVFPNYHPWLPNASLSFYSTLPEDDGFPENSKPMSGVGRENLNVGYSNGDNNDWGQALGWNTIQNEIWATTVSNIGMTGCGAWLGGGRGTWWLNRMWGQNGAYNQSQDLPLLLPPAPGYNYFPAPFLRAENYLSFFTPNNQSPQSITKWLGATATPPYAFNMPGPKYLPNNLFQGIDNECYIMTRNDWVGTRPTPNGQMMSPYLEPLTAFIKISMRDLVNADSSIIAERITSTLHKIAPIWGLNGETFNLVLGQPNNKTGMLNRGGQFPFVQNAGLIVPQDFIQAQPALTVPALPVAEFPVQVGLTTALATVAYNSLPSGYKVTWDTLAKVSWGNSIQIIPANFQRGANPLLSKGSNFQDIPRNVADYIPVGDRTLQWNGLPYSNMGFKNFGKMWGGDRIMRASTWSGKMLQLTGSAAAFSGVAPQQTSIIERYESGSTLDRRFGSPVILNTQLRTWFVPVNSPVKEALSNPTPGEPQNAQIQCAQELYQFQPVYTNWEWNDENLELFSIAMKKMENFSPDNISSGEHLGTDDFTEPTNWYWECDVGRTDDYQSYFDCGAQSGIIGKGIMFPSDCTVPIVPSYLQPGPTGMNLLVEPTWSVAPFVRQPYPRDVSAPTLPAPATQTTQIGLQTLVPLQPYSCSGVYQPGAALIEATYNPEQNTGAPETNVFKPNSWTSLTGMTLPFPRQGGNSAISPAAGGYVIVGPTLTCPSLWSPSYMREQSPQSWKNRPGLGRLKILSRPVLNLYDKMRTATIDPATGLGKLNPIDNSPYPQEQFTVFADVGPFASFSPQGYRAGCEMPDSKFLKTEAADAQQKWNVALSPYIYHDADGGSHKLIALPVFKEYTFWDAFDDAILAPKGNTNLIEFGCLSWGNYIGVSPSFIDNHAITPGNFNQKEWNNGNKIGTTETLAGVPVGTYAIPNFMNPANWTNWAQLGSINPTVAFNGDSGRFEISYLHTSLKLQNYAAPRSNYTPPAAGTDAPANLAQSGTECTRVNTNLGQYIAPFPYVAPGQPDYGPTPPSWGTDDQLITKNTGLMGEISGMGIWKIWLPPPNWESPHSINLISYWENNWNNQGGSVGVAPLSNEEKCNRPARNGTKENHDAITKHLIEADVENFTGTFLNKLGFEFEDLISTSGLSSNRFSPFTWNKETRSVAGQGARWLRTNEEIDSAQNQDYNINFTWNSDAVAVDEKGVPAYGTGFLNNQAVNIETASSIIQATNGPIASATPYFLILSDIIPTQYEDGIKKLPCIFYCMKNYGAQGYYYGYSSTFTQTCDYPRLITQIQTEIRNPINSKLCRLNEGTVVVYKITRDIRIPLPTATPDDVDDEYSPETMVSTMMDEAIGNPTGQSLSTYNIEGVNVKMPIKIPVRGSFTPGILNAVGDEPDLRLGAPNPDNIDAGLGVLLPVSDLPPPGIGDIQVAQEGPALEPYANLMRKITAVRENVIANSIINGLRSLPQNMARSFMKGDRPAGEEELGQPGKAAIAVMKRVFATSVQEFQRLWTRFPLDMATAENINAISEGIGSEVIAIMEEGGQFFSNQNGVKIDAEEYVATISKAGEKRIGFSQGAIMDLAGNAVDLFAEIVASITANVKEQGIDLGTGIVEQSAIVNMSLQEFISGKRVNIETYNPQKASADWLYEKNLSQKSFPEAKEEDQREGESASYDPEDATRDAIKAARLKKYGSPTIELATTITEVITNSLMNSFQQGNIGFVPADTQEGTPVAQAILTINEEGTGGNPAFGEKYADPTTSDSFKVNTTKMDENTMQMAAAMVKDGGGGRVMEGTQRERRERQREIVQRGLTAHRADRRAGLEPMEARAEEVLEFGRRVEESTGKKIEGLEELHTETGPGVRNVKGDGSFDTGKLLENVSRVLTEARRINREAGNPEEFKASGPKEHENRQGERVTESKESEKA